MIHNLARHFRRVSRKGTIATVALGISFARLIRTTAAISLKMEVDPATAEVSSPTPATITTDLSTSEVPVIAFLHGGLDPLGRRFDEMLAYSDDRMEECHDYVQWMWPLHEESHFASVFPVLTQDVADVLAKSEQARGRLLAGLARFRSFYGVHEDGKVDDDKVQQWCHNGDHNLLRITRIIRSLRILGLEEPAQQFYKDMTAVGEANGLSETTLRYWKRAAEEPPLSPLRDAPRWRR